MDDDYSEMIGETPALVRGDTLELPDLGGPGAELSTGLILTWRDRLVFGLEPRAIPLGAQGREDVAAFTGIGGHLDPGEAMDAGRGARGNGRGVLSGVAGRRRGDLLLRTRPNAGAHGLPLDGGVSAAAGVAGRLQSASRAESRAHAHHHGKCRVPRRCTGPSDPVRRDVRPIPGGSGDPLAHLCRTASVGRVIGDGRGGRRTDPAAGNAAGPRRQRVFLCAVAGVARATDERNG